MGNFSYAMNNRVVLGFCETKLQIITSLCTPITCSTQRLSLSIRSLKPFYALCSRNKCCLCRLHFIESKWFVSRWIMRGVCTVTWASRDGNVLNESDEATTSWGPPLHVFYILFFVFFRFSFAAFLESQRFWVGKIFFSLCFEFVRSWLGKVWARREFGVEISEPRNGIFGTFKSALLAHRFCKYHTNCEAGT